MKRKRNTMTAWALAAALAAGLTGCGSASSAPSGSATAQPSPTATASPQAQQTGCRTGFGVMVALTEGEMKGKATSTAAGVLLDDAGRILRCVIDVAENEMAATAEGALAMPGAYATKWEKGDSYGLRSASSIGKEWYEQVQALCSRVQGMTGDELYDLATDDGYAAEPDLASSCTIQVTPLLAAVSKACDNAQPLGAGEGDSLRLGTVSTASGRDATATGNGTAQVDTTFVLLTMDADGRVTSAIMDEVEPALDVDEQGNLTAPAGTVASKLELGDRYGLGAVSSIGKEWDEQSRGFCAFLQGKTAGEIRGVPATGEDPDLAAVCTIDWSAMLQAAVKAAEAE